MAKKPRTPPPPRPVQAPKRRDEPSRSGLDRRWLLGGLAVLVAIGVGVGLAVGLSGGGGSSPAKPIDWAALPGLQTGPPPWGNDDASLAARLQALGLDQLPSEGTVLHIHQYLDLWVNGKHVALPPDVGITSTFITELHVHVGEPNIIHVESPVQRTFRLGQVFGEWGVKLTSRCVGSFCGTLSWWVDGAKQAGDPAELALREHQVIVIALGKPPATIPKTYAWNGL